MQFQIGDLVEVIKEFERCPIGVIGVIKRKGMKNYAIEFDKTFPGCHSCGGTCKQRYGYWVSPLCLTLKDTNITIIEYAERLHKQAI